MNPKAVAMSKTNNKFDHFRLVMLTMLTLVFALAAVRSRGAGRRALRPPPPL